MTDTTPLKTDEDGIPILDTAVAPDAVQDIKPAPGIDLSDQEQVELLLENEAVQSLLADLTEDLQKLVSWKMEELLKGEIHKLIHEATERSMPRLFDDIQTQLRLALPELLAKIVEQGDHQDTP